jgi:hypothetical protein
VKTAKAIKLNATILPAAADANATTSYCQLQLQLLLLLQHHQLLDMMG